MGSEARAEKNRKRVVERYRERVSGWPKGSFDAAVEAQGGRCAICEQVKKLCADHDHTNGRPRAAICQGCNARVGFEESSPLRAKVQEYIATWKVNHGQNANLG